MDRGDLSKRCASGRNRMSYGLPGHFFTGVLVIGV